MKLFSDVLTGDELFSDAYDLKEIDGIVYEVDAKMITLGATSVNTGANASAEEAEEALEEGATQVINLIHSSNLASTSFDKKSYLTTLKAYMKAVKAHLQEKHPDQVEEFEKGAQGFAKKVVANFKDYEFYTGESMNPDGMVILLNYREDGVTPYFTFWKHGLKEEKI